MFQEWVEKADVDGFNVGSVTNPGSWEDVVDLLRPELVKGGLMWEDYPAPGKTFRENLLGTATLMDYHYGSKAKWGTEKASLVGQIVSEKVVEPVVVQAESVSVLVALELVVVVKA